MASFVKKWHKINTSDMLSDIRRANMETPTEWTITPEEPCECYATGSDVRACDMHLKAALGEYYTPREQRFVRKTVISTRIR